MALPDHLARFGRGQAPPRPILVGEQLAGDMSREPNLHYPALRCVVPSCPPPRFSLSSDRSDHLYARRS